MRKNAKEIAAIEAELGLNAGELLAIPSLGTNFCHLNSTTAGKAKRLITDKGHELVSVKTSDIRFSYTLGEATISNFEYGNVVRDSYDKPVKAKSDLVLAFRFSSRNFFVKGSLSTLYTQMADALKYEIQRQAKFLNKEALEIITTNLEERLKSGTAFVISSIVTHNPATGHVVHWKRKQAGGVFKMALYEFKGLWSTKYITAAPDNQNLWHTFCGDLWVDDCLSVHTPKDGMTCAYLALKAY